MENFDVDPRRIGESAQRVIDRAIEEAHRRNHRTLGNEHLLLAFAQMEWDMFFQAMQDAGINPHKALNQIGDYLKTQPPSFGRELIIAPITKLTFKLANLEIGRAGRPT